MRVEGVRNCFYVIGNFSEPHEVAAYIQHLNHSRDNIVEADGGIEKVNKRDVYEYSGARGNAFRLSFLTRRAFYDVRRVLTDARDCALTLYEHKSVNLPLRFMVETHIVPMGWVSAPLARKVSASETKCGADYELEDGGASLQSLSGDLGHAALDPTIADTVSELRVVWFDIECVSGDKAFPQPETAQVIMIGVLCAEGDRVLRKCLFHLSDVEKLADDADDLFVQCESEAMLIRAFAEFVAHYDADLVAGYNSGGFDFPFLFKRAEVIDCLGDFARALSRTHYIDAKLETTHFESSAHGSRDSFTVDMHGRCAYDLLEILRREYRNLSTYTLNAVSEHFLNDHKADVHHSMIPVLFRRSAADRRRLAQYCLKDVQLPFQIDRKLHLQMRLIEMARVCGVDFSTLLERGQQIKIVSQLLRVCLAEGYVLPLGSNPTGYEPHDYEGGAVLEPHVGFYDTTKPVMVADFASLYPSIMISRNMCYTTYVPKSRVREFPADSVYLTAAGHHFLKRSAKQGLLSKLFESLLRQRKMAKQDMKAAAAKGDTVRESVMDSRQLALKVSANSIYGFTGVALRSGGKLPLFEASESTTAEGRKALKASAKYVEDHYADATVVYGDSVAPEQTLMLRFQRKRIVVTKAECCAAELAEAAKIDGNGKGAATWKPWGGDKECIDLNFMRVDTFTDNGWVRVKRLIRHALEPGRRMRMVVTPAGFVRCTEDHSLIRAGDKQSALPADVNVGDELLTFVSKWGVSGGSEEGAEADETVAQRMRALAHFFVVGEVPSTNYFYFDFQCRNKISHQRVIPEWLYQKKRCEIKAFWDFIVTLHANNVDAALCWVNSLRDGEQELFHGMWIVTRLFINLPIVFDERGFLKMRGDGEEATTGEAGSSEGRCLYNEPYYTHDEVSGRRAPLYVYDLQTRDSHFSTFGLVVHNTDSIFVRRESITTMAQAWEFLNTFAPAITAELFASMPPMKLEPEKVVTPFLSIAKKRYAGVIYESPKSAGELFFKGMEVVRRDNCPLVTKVLMQVSDMLFMKRDIEGALEVVREAVRKLYMGQVPLSELILTRSLSREPDEYSNKQPHAELVKRMRAEDEGSAPRVGDRVLHVMVERGAQKVFDMAEDPIKVIEQTLPINRKYYIENQMQGPVERLLVPVVGEERVRELFNGAHTRKRVVKADMQKGTIGSFFQVQKKCSLCKTPVQGAGSVCDDCKKRKSSEISDKCDAKREDLAQAQEAYEKVVKSCQACLGIDGEVVCMQRDCAQLYDRLEKKNRVVKLGADIEDLITE